ncbi:MAG: L,D-transpeptidase family protein [Candidatus Omnitrophica bacterium]|nr:L,D-transpeptidase family protein [Candidatus Omnitrophota bacterium]
MKKNIIRICAAAAAVVIVLVAARLLFDFSRNKKTTNLSGDAPVSSGRQSKTLKRVNDLLLSGKKSEAVSELEKIADSFKGKQEGYEAVSMLADIYNKDGNFVKAKSMYHEIISSYSQFCDYAFVQKNISSVNMSILFSDIVAAGSELYTVAPGDSLAKIAKRFSTTVELIQKANGLKSDVIIPGVKLKVQNRPFSIIVDNTQCVLTVLLDDEVIKTYDVATGKNNCTPIGVFQIKDKLINPVWYNKGTAVPAGSPENVLGTRWMGLATPQSGYGIHGTTEPESIGYQSTEGCVRMRNEDVEELYSIIPVGTSVTVIE